MLKYKKLQKFLFVMAIIVCSISVIYFVRPNDFPGTLEQSSTTPRISAFDSLVNKNGGKVPFPFNNILMQIVDTRDRKFFPPLIPYGRSLQKSKSNLKNPRILVGGSNYYNPIFLGYAPEAEQVEVISWNSQEGQFDFLEVKDYSEGKSPHVVQSDRAVCMKCHQAGGPIFARGGDWREIRHIVDGKNKIAQLIFQARNGVPYYHGVNLLAYATEIDPALSPTHFDVLVRRANRKQQVTKIFREICGNNLQCRQILIASALLYPNPHGLIRSEFGSDPDGDREAITDVIKRTQAFSESQILEKLTPFISKWPSVGYAYPTSMLPDRDFLLLKNPNPGYVFVGPSFGQAAPPADFKYNLPSIDPQNITYDENHSPFTAIIPADGKDNFFWKEIPLSPSVAFLADPEFPRPSLQAIEQKDAAKIILNGASEALGFEKEDYANLQLLDQGRLSQIVNSGDMIRFLEKWPVDKKLLFRTLYKATGKEIPELYRPDVIKPAETAISSNPNSVDPFFNKYCMTCHDGGSFPPPLPFEKWAALRTYHVSHSPNERLVDYISNKTMPPAGALQPSDSDRAQILKYIESLND